MAAPRGLLGKISFLCYLHSARLQGPCSVSGFRRWDFCLWCYPAQQVATLASYRGGVERGTRKKNVAILQRVGQWSLAWLHCVLFHFYELWVRWPCGFRNVFAGCMYRQWTNFAFFIQFWCIRWLEVQYIMDTVLLLDVKTCLFMMICPWWSLHVF